MTPIEAFIRARLREEEEEALAAAPGPWSVMVEECGYDFLDYNVESGPDEEVSTSRGDQYGYANARHIARHDPDRVLREVAAKYVILDQCAEIEDSWGVSSWWYSIRAEAILAALASVWSDHPDYDPRWAE